MLWGSLLSAVLAASPALAGPRKFKAGESLEQLAEDHYGDKHYSLVLVKLNKIKDDKKVAPGTEIRMPDLKEMLLNEGFPKALEPELEQVMKARYSYIKVHSELEKALHPENGTGKIQIPMLVQTELKGAADALDKAGKSLNKGGNFSESSTRMRQRLQKCAENFRKLAKGSQEKGLEASVHLLFAQAFVRGLMWALNEDGDVKSDDSAK